MVEDHSDSERGNPLSPHRPLFPISSILYVSSHRQDNTYHGLSYTSRGALAETRNWLMGPPHEWSIRRPSRGALAGTRNCLMGPTTKDRSTNDPSHHELLPRSYISLPLPPPPPPTHTHAHNSDWQPSTFKHGNASCTNSWHLLKHFVWILVREQPFVLSALRALGSCCSSLMTNLNRGNTGSPTLNVMRHFPFLWRHRLFETVGSALSGERL